MSIERIDLTNAVEDYNLEVDQTAVINFVETINVPLHIATENGTGYELKLFNAGPAGAGSEENYGVILLYPNNNSKSGDFIYEEIASGSNYVSGRSRLYNSFRIGFSYSTIISTINNNTTFKSLQCHTTETNTIDVWAIIINSTCVWEDITTPWISLGTIVFPFIQTGSIIVKRVL